ncbi:MAG: DUF6713 family protein [Dysgonomonas sp.]
MTEFCLFYIGLSLFLIHEMDAIRCEEWKIFPVLSSLSDRKGYYIYHSSYSYIYSNFLVYNKYNNSRDLY